jgi:hypothetical protein
VTADPGTVGFMRKIDNILVYNNKLGRQDKKEEQVCGNIFAKPQDCNGFVTKRLGNEDFVDSRAEATWQERNLFVDEEGENQRKQLKVRKLMLISSF